MSGTVYRIVYFSRALRVFDLAALGELERRASMVNAAVGVTGILLYDGDRFLQVLEGEELVVEALMAGIEADPRHDSITYMQRESVAERQFGDWWMTACQVNSADEFIAAAKAGVAVVDDPRLRAAVIGFAAIGARMAAGEGMRASYSG